MKNTDRHIKLNKWLYPIALLYSSGVVLRNKLFDWNILKSKTFPLPVISIGNLTVGGTGKTPHTEYLLSFLTDKFNVAVISRGYKRKTKGFLLAKDDSTSQDIGDEPFQIKYKFKQAVVAVDAKRCRAIENILALDKPRVDVVLLDDAYQHRYVKAGLSILLTDYNRLICDDKLLPVGNLREPLGGRHRANIVIVTKCPSDIKPIDYNIVTKRLGLYPFQRLYFSTFKYGKLYPVFGGQQDEIALENLSGFDDVLLVTGIANPLYLKEELSIYSQKLQTMTYKDHHNFSKKDLEAIDERFKSLKGPKKIILTTEKDAMRFLNMPNLQDSIKQALYAIPVEIEILQDKQIEFNKNILDYVREDQRNS